MGHALVLTSVDFSAAGVSAGRQRGLHAAALLSMATVAAFLPVSLQMLAATAMWRLRPIANSHQMTASFFDYWTLQRAQGRIVRSRIYLAIDWWDLLGNEALRRTFPLQNAAHTLCPAVCCLTCSAVRAYSRTLLGC